MNKSHSCSINADLKSRQQLFLSKLSTNHKTRRIKQTVSRRTRTREWVKRGERDGVLSLSRGILKLHNDHVPVSVAELRKTHSTRNDRSTRPLGRVAIFVAT